MTFTVTHKDASSSARTGQMDLAHGPVQTPVFMPVGTQGAVKGVSMVDMKSLGFNLLLANTYHLNIRPGSELIKKHGGLHGFSQWTGNILTDSGGFQVFSLSPLRTIKNEGVSFRSHVDGARLFFTPESVVRVQQDFNSDIQMVLDVCTSPGITWKKAKEAAYITSSWAKRAILEYGRTLDEGYQGALFGIVQGNFFKDLRTISAEELVALDFPGYAIGGLSVGEEYAVFQDFLHHTAPLLPESKPKYLMGIGTPEYILDAVENGIDMFDCVFPTRIARNGTFFTKEGRLVIKNERYKSDLLPIEEGSPIEQYSRAYLRHLFKAEEMLGPMLASQHNLYFLKNMMEEIRAAIKDNCFMQYKKDFLDRYKQGIS